MTLPGQAIPSSATSSVNMGREQADITKTATLQPVSAVIPKFYNKATSPPVTIRSFFKPHAPKGTDEGCRKHESHENQSCANGAGNEVCAGVEEGEGKVGQIDSDGAQDSKAGSSPGRNEARNAPSPRAISRIKDGSEGAGECPGTGHHGDDTPVTGGNEEKDPTRENKCAMMASDGVAMECGKLTRTNASCRSAAVIQGEPRGIKRTGSAASIGSLSSQGSTARKRQKTVKQASLMASFSKMEKKKKENADKKLCPICHHTFEPGTTNEKVNEHVDNCLIE